MQATFVSDMGHWMALMTLVIATLAIFLPSKSGLEEIRNIALTETLQNLISRANFSFAR